MITRGRNEYKGTVELLSSMFLKVFNLLLNEICLIVEQL